VSGYLARILSTRAERIHGEPTLAEVYINPITNATWVEGDRIKRLKLAASLEIIAEEGANALYSRNGTLLGPLMADIKSINSILVEEDFLDYKVEWGSAVETVLAGDQKLYTVPLPGTGAVLTFMLDLLKGYKVADDGLTYHRMTEAMKFGYAKRTHMGDTAFVPGMEAVSLLERLIRETFRQILHFSAGGQHDVERIYRCDSQPN
jgi:gamma-glutamyltranspeptidase / glutathione hydrolase / leukotriene-C4 hydrolase